MLVPIFIVFFYLSLPEVTFNQARHNLNEQYKVDLIEEYSVPAYREDWDFFGAKRSYFFVGIQDGEKVYFLVSANTGKVFKVDGRYP